MFDHKANNGNSNFYSRSNSPQNGTIVPEMHNKNAGSNPNDPMRPIGPANTQYERPVVGFLYSISRKGVGEYWPLHPGTNTIGRNEGCDIVLKEATVSGEHALLQIKQMESTGEILAQIKDAGSANGVWVDNNELRFDYFQCESGNILAAAYPYKRQGTRAVGGRRVYPDRNIRTDSPDSRRQQRQNRRLLRPHQPQYRRHRGHGRRNIRIQRRRHPIPLTETHNDISGHMSHRDVASRVISFH